MKPAISPTLDAVFTAFFVASIAGGFACCFCTLYGGFLLSLAQKKLLQGLQESAPAVYERLRDPIWRGHIALWNLQVFLRSQELDDVPAIYKAKAGCRCALRCQTRGMLGFGVAWVFGLAVGALAVALGSTEIRFSG